MSRIVPSIVVSPSTMRAGLPMNRSIFRHSSIQGRIPCERVISKADFNFWRISCNSVSRLIALPRMTFRLVTGRSISLKSISLALTSMPIPIFNRGSPFLFRSSEIMPQIFFLSQRMSLGHLTLAWMPMWRSSWAMEIAVICMSCGYSLGANPCSGYRMLK